MSRDDDPPLSVVEDIDNAEILIDGGAPRAAEPPNPVADAIFNAEVFALPAKEPAGGGPPREPPGGPPAAGGGGLPIIRIVPGGIADATTKSEAALCRGAPVVFQRGNVLVRPGHHELTASDDRVTISAGLHELTRAGAVDLLSQAAEFQTWSVRRKKWVRCDPPQAVAAALLSRAGQWRLPTISGVVTTPTMRPDGSILSTPGFDPRTRLFYFKDPNFNLAPMADRPSRADAEAALEDLQHLL